MIVEDDIEGDGTMNVSITDTEKNGDGMNAYVTYTVKTKTLNSPTWGDRDMTAIRRYSDFVWLHDGLKAEFKAVIIPPLPEKGLINRFSPEFIEYRRYELERFLRRVVAHPKLAVSTVTKAFLESSRELNKLEVKTEEPKPQKKKGFFSSITEKVTTIAGVAVEIDQWFSDMKEYLKGLETQLQLFHTKASVATKKRKEFVQIWKELAEAANDYANVETEKDKVLHNLFDKLGEISNQISALQKETVEQEVTDFEFSIKDYIRITGAVKEMLLNRDLALLKFQNAEKNLEQKKQKHEKNTSASKASGIQAEVSEAERQRDNLRAQFDQVTKECKEEIDQFLKTKNKEITTALRNLVQTNMNHELRVLDLWKELLQLIEES